MGGGFHILSKQFGNISEMSSAALTVSLSTAQASCVTSFVDFLNAAVTPFHAVATIAGMLRQAGYEQLAEPLGWSSAALAPGQKAFVIRNDSSIVAFAVGGKYTTGNGFKIIGAHTDSPNLQLKPKSHSVRGKYMGVGVQLYGGGLWHTWFDRDLTVAGRLVLQRAGATHVSSTLVNLKRPILRIPTLAIHLASTDERDKFAPNKETHIAPIIATQLAAQLNGKEQPQNGQNSTLLHLLADAAGVTTEEISDFDLSVIDTQPSCVGGAYGEFVFSPRLDNLISCFAAVTALINETSTLNDDSKIRMVGLFDHEEVGSSSPHGAAGTLIPDIVDRFHTGEASSLRPVATANSFFLSVDGGHAVHPNYPEKHEAEHRPMLHYGPVIKYNANVRYATNGMSGAIVKALAVRSGVPIQQFCVKNDAGCGSTIGPILSTLTGIVSADIGNPMLSMHSIREMCGTIDVCHLVQLLRTFWTDYDLVAQSDR